jgi:hypothetical protein
MNRRHDIEPYWQDEDDWLCTVEFLPSNDPEGRVFAADIVGYLFGYAQLTNARALALVGDPEAGAYELLFSFSTPGTKTRSWIWFAPMRSWGTTTSRTTLCHPQLKRFGPLVRSRRSCQKTF